MRGEYRSLLNFYIGLLALVVCIRNYYNKVYSQGGVMKKLLVLLCFSVVSTAVSAQTVPPAENGLPKKAAQRQGEVKAPALPVSVEAAIERHIAQTTQRAAMEKTENPTDIAHEHPVRVPGSDKPSYYVTQDAYQVCKDVELCAAWAAGEARREVHFQVISAVLVQKEDLHHSKLIVTYVKDQDAEKKVFEETFDGWKEL